ncbi:MULTISPECIES: hypothetical protein [unclassified Mesorhizobium]|nr:MULTISPECIES: hypothetical protein [unclassified Mesorhizobium]
MEEDLGQTIGPQFQKVQIGFLEEVQTEGGRPNRVPSMRLDRLGEG